MIELTIPGQGVIRLQHLVLDVNGTLAVDGRLIEGVHPLLDQLRDRLEIHLITADTHGGQAALDRQLGVQAHRLQAGNEAEQKAAFVRSLGADQVIAIGQGANDALMLREARIGVCVLSPEGTAVSTLQSADLCTAGILPALELLTNPMRLVATLRK